ncbi:MAG TPA: hypothetical protein VFS20_22875, partial [Longimicrobium sp.]|nr:hypothetical protein [Longimicrobium sp.]
PWCYESDSVGVPTPEEMERAWGGCEQWQAPATDHWIEGLLRNDPGVDVAVLDGQTRPSMIREVFARRSNRRLISSSCTARWQGPPPSASSTFLRTKSPP